MSGPSRSMKTYPILAMFCMAFGVALAFTPQHWAFGVGSENLSITLRRIIILITCIVLLPNCLRILYRQIKSHKSNLETYFGILLVLAFFSSMLIGIALGQGTSSFFRFFDLLVVYLAVGSVVNYCVTRGREVQFLNSLFIVPVILIFPFVIIEVYFEVNAFGYVSDLFTSANSTFATPVFMRNNYVRAEGPFFDPINFAEFLCVCWVYALYRLSKRRSLGNVFYAFLILILLILCNTRSGFIVAFVSLFLMYGIINRWPMKFIIATFLAGVTLGFTEFLYLLIDFSTTSDFDFASLNSDSERSVASRILQYGKVIVLISEKPFFGFGFSRNLPDRFELHALDNYYFSILLEGGGFLLLSFIGYFLTIFYKFLRVTDRVPVERGFGIFAITLFLSFMSMKFFNSSDHGIPYMFVIYFIVLAKKDSLLKFERAEQIVR
ncbi:O-antigen ligase family protein [Luminiphilus sp.]|nr:O-antigen ligase family protein [Luminiphilus sp.]